VNRGASGANKLRWRNRARRNSCSDVYTSQPWDVISNCVVAVAEFDRRWHCEGSIWGWLVPIATMPAISRA